MLLRLISVCGMCRFYASPVLMFREYYSSQPAKTATWAEAPQSDADCCWWSILSPKYAVRQTGALTWQIQRVRHFRLLAALLKYLNHSDSSPFIAKEAAHS